MKVIVVGGGWAGLAAAVKLSEQDIPVTLLESAKQVGGRARSIDQTINGFEWHIDNGQHLMLGAYREILALLRILGIHERKVFKRNLLNLDMRSPSGENIRLQVPNVAAPIHLLWGLLRAKGLSIHERGTALRLCARLVRTGFKIKSDQPLEKWLLQHGQTRKLIKYLWQPLCLAALNTPINEASTEVFLVVLKDSFAAERDDSDMLFVLPQLNDSFPDHAVRYINHHQGLARTSQRVTDLLIEDNQISGVKTEDGHISHGDHVILATPPWITSQLLAKHAATQGLSTTLQEINYYPICTVYLQYPPQTKLGSDLIGMVDTVGQWVFDRAINDQAGLMSVVISGPGDHMEMDNETLIKTITEELAQINSHWPAPIASQVIREKRATFGCHADINQLRPDNTTAVKGLWLAGDYLDTGYPATLEGAVRTGVKSAEAIIACDTRYV